MQRRSTHQCNPQIDPHPEMETEFYGKEKSNPKTEPGYETSTN